MEYKSCNLNKEKIEHYLMLQNNQNIRIKTIIIVVIIIMILLVKKARKFSYIEEQNQFVLLKN